MPRKRRKSFTVSGRNLLLRLFRDSATVVCDGAAGWFVMAAMDGDPRFETISTSLSAMLAIFSKGTPSLAGTFRGSLCSHSVWSMGSSTWSPASVFISLRSSEGFRSPNSSSFRNLRICCSRESELHEISVFLTACRPFEQFSIKKENHRGRCTSYSQIVPISFVKKLSGHTSYT
jgi:hypothetical protein